jgi:hypothetical protein
MCGAQASYPHDLLCPYPYYGRDVEKESAWLDAWRKNKNKQLHIDEPGADHGSDRDRIEPDISSRNTFAE